MCSLCCSRCIVTLLCVHCSCFICTVYVVLCAVCVLYVLFMLFSVCSLCSVCAETTTARGGHKPARQIRCHSQGLAEFLQQKKVTAVQTHKAFLGTKGSTWLNFYGWSHFFCRGNCAELTALPLTVSAHRCHQNNGNKSGAARTFRSDHLALHI